MTKRQQDLFETDPAPWDLDEAADQLVATVVFAAAPFGPFDYRVPDTLHNDVGPGRRVRVPLGRGNRGVVGYCISCDQRSEGERRLKDIQAVIDADALLTPTMLRVTEWMADYYLCPWGQVLEGVVPAGVRGQAGTREMTFLSVPTHVAAKLTQLKLPPKQAHALRLLAASSRPLTTMQLANAAKCTMVPINGLREKKLVHAETRRVYHGEFDESVEKRQPNLNLNPDQQNALEAILATLHSGRHETLLLHGVTGSGKTEVYIRAIDEMIGFGRQAIVLVPEISLTPQTRQRFRSRFDKVAVLHSHLSDSERHWHWQRIARGEVQVVVGARSAVFAPTPHLGMIVLDEEHDSSFKQDIAPRYHARDVALHRAQSENIPLVLGSATPSLESWQRAQDGQYRLLDLPNRVLDLPLPDVTTIDLRAEFRSHGSRGAISRQLHQAIYQAIRDDGQVILLLNRRGYSTTIQCPACGHVVRCQDCDIPLTHHRDKDRAVCHYCDYSINSPTTCPECQSGDIRHWGLGTQRLEQEIGRRFRGVPCLRMDSDTMQRPGSHEEALERFRAGEVKILFGTQMIAKGLDFPNVTLVGVINADTALHFPDFRAAERTFQLVTQVAGRTGRGEKGGRVLVQTSSPDHAAIQAAIRHDYATFAEQEVPERERFRYPPMAAMIRLIFRGPTESVTEQFAEHVVDRLREGAERRQADVRILGPAEAPIAKLRGKYRFHSLLQGEDRAEMREIVREATGNLKPPQEVQWVVDVDPLDLL